MSLEGDEAFATVHAALTGSAPAAVGKLGTFELELAYFRFKTRRFSVSPSILPKMLQSLSRNTGLFPSTQETACRMADELLQSLLFLDCTPNWYMKDQALELLDAFAKRAQRVSLQSLECFLSPNPAHWWTATKARILVISPFAASVEAQVPRLQSIWASRKGLWHPESTFQTIAFPLSFGVQSPEIQKDMLAKWTDSFGLIRSVQAQMDSLDYDVAIVGVGIHSLPLVVHAKRKGKKALHLGGATQLLFGIRGGRWDTMAEFQPLFNEHWVRPDSVKERPTHFEAVENGCYW
jgi:hypothetical protein